MMVVVGLDDGIILDLSRCVIFDDEAIGDADQRLLNVGTESDAISVAERHGTKLHSILARCGYGELHYGNCLSLSPSALHTEFVELPTLLTDVPDEVEGLPNIKEMFAWGASLGFDELEELAEYILQDDELWQAWRIAVVDALEIAYRQHKKEQEKS